MPWNFRSCSDSSLKAGVSSTSSSLIRPRRWLLLALIDSFFEKPSRVANLDAPPIQVTGADKTTPRGVGQGATAPLEVRLATEAAGAAHVVDRSPPGEGQSTTHSRCSVSNQGRVTAVCHLQAGTPRSWGPPPS